MTEVNKKIIQVRTTMKRTALCIKNGIFNVKSKKSYKITLVLYLMFFILLTYICIYRNIENPIIRAFNIIGCAILIAWGSLLLLFFFGSPILSWKVQVNLTRAGFYNAAGETPLLLRKEADVNNPLCFYLYFDSIGLPFSEWIDKTEKIQNALNIIIGEAEWGENQHTIILHCAPGNYKYPSKIIWKDEYLSNDEGVLALGVCATGIKYLDLNIFPHILLAGSTGSGKTVFLHCLIWQCIRLGYHVTVVDMKGGIDFLANAWRRKIKIIDELKTVEGVLEGLLREIDRRKLEFSAVACPNIKRYNEKYPYQQFTREILCIDELAEVLDKTGLNSKEEKALASSIERGITTLIRLGRAYGIHLILCTQRPDCTIINGQIRSDIDARYCSRCESTLSEIMLGDAEASKRIPKNELGLFMGADKIIFKSFILDENELDKYINYNTADKT